MIQHMLAIWSLVPLPFLKPACTSESSRFVYCWSLVWKILSITLLAWMFKLSHYTCNSLKTFISRISYLFVFCENCICILQWRIKIYQNFIGFENFTLLANYMHTFFVLILFGTASKNTIIFVPLYIWSMEKAVEPHSSTLAWKIPWTEEPGRLQSMGSLRVGHDWATSLSLFSFMHWRRKWQPTPVFLPGESQGQQSLVGCCLWGRTESDTTEVT